MDVYLMHQKNNYNWKIATQALHSGEEIKHADSHVTPIFATSTFLFPNVEIGNKRFSGEESGYIYSRLANPTVEVSEKKIAILEGAKLLQISWLISQVRSKSAYVGDTCKFKQLSSLQINGSIR